VIQGVVTDADGVGNSIYGFLPTGRRAHADGRQQAIAPGGEIKVRLLVPIAQGTAPLKTMTLWERDSQPQTVDIAGVQPPGLKPPANFAALNLKGGTNEFKACGKTLDVRFEGFRKARDGSYEAFFTFKNTSESLLRTDVLDMHSSSVDIDLHDAKQNVAPRRGDAAQRQHRPSHEPRRRSARRRRNQVPLSFPP
jgi:hypothetical protein